MKKVIVFLVIISTLLFMVSCARETETKPEEIFSDEIYYLNFPEGNDSETRNPDEHGAHPQYVITYSKIDDFKNKMSSLDFTDKEKKIIKETFKKTDKGFPIFPKTYYYEPTFSDDYSITSIEWYGEYYTVGIDGDNVKILCSIAADYSTIRDQYFKQSDSLEEMQKNELYSNVIKSESSENGLNYTIYNYDTSVCSNKQIRWEISDKKNKYTVLECYTDQKGCDITNESSGEILLTPDKPYLVHIAVETPEGACVLYISTPKIDITKEFVTQFGLKRKKV